MTTSLARFDLTQRGVTDRFGFGLAVVLLLTLFKWKVPQFASATPYLVFYPAIIVIAFMAGARTAIAMALLSAFLVEFFFFEPVFSVKITDTQSILRCLLFMITTIFTSWAIDAMRTARARLQIIEGRFNALLEHSPATIFMKDLDGRYLFISAKAGDHVGVPTARYPGKTARELFPPQIAKAFEDTDHQVLETGTSHESEFMVQGPEGPRYFLNAKFPLRDAKGGIYGIAGITTEITERKNAEFERNHLLERAKKARVRTEKALELLMEERRLREQFVLTLTHDLKNPISAARSAAEMLLKTDAGRERLAGLALESIHRLERMINDLLDASQIQGGRRLPIKIDPHDYSELISRTVQQLNLSEHNRFFLVVDISAGGYRGYCDADGVQRVVENLAKNASKYGDPEAPITLRLSRKADYVEISVHNFGNPIPQSVQETLFNPFKRSYQAEKSGKKGWGIGLTLVKGMCEAHGGCVTVESSAEKGTIFTARFLLDARSTFSRAFAA